MNTRRRKHICAQDRRRARARTRTHADSLTQASHGQPFMRWSYALTKQDPSGLEVPPHQSQPDDPSPLWEIRSLYPSHPVPSAARDPRLAHLLPLPHASTVIGTPSAQSHAHSCRTPHGPPHQSCQSCDCISTWLCTSRPPTALGFAQPHLHYHLTGRPANQKRLSATTTPARMR